MENNEDKYFECSTTLKSLLLPILAFLAFILFMWSGYCLSTLYFYGKGVFCYFPYHLFFLMLLSAILILTIPTVVSASCKYTFYKDKIDFCFKYIKRKNFSFKYEDIEYFANIRYFGIDIKTKNTKIPYRLYVPKEYVQKIIEILNSKISDLSESKKWQDMSDKDISKLHCTVPIYSFLGFVCMFMIIPVSSFFDMKAADYNLNKFIKSNFEDDKSLDTARQLYLSAWNNKCYYVHKQLIKIDVFRNKLLEEDIEYTNKLFPNKKDEIENLRKNYSYGNTEIFKQ